MADKEKNKGSVDNFFERDIDPSLAAKVDKMMSEDLKPEKKAPKDEAHVEDEAAGGAPLLPTDKLPAFIRKAQKKESKPAEKPKESNKNEAETSKEKSKEVESPPKDENPKADQSEHDKVDLEAPETENAVEEIEHAEADRMLAIEDAKAEMLADGDAVISESLMDKIKYSLANLWSKKPVRVFVILLVMASLAAAAAYPDSRYFLLNKFGVRASTSLTVLDEKTAQPLKDVEVSLQGQTAKTDKEGYVSFADLKLGRNDLRINKPAFAPVLSEVTLGWGSNPLGDFELTAVGSRYSFELVDFLSGEPVTKAEAISGNASAVADPKGLLTIVVDNQDGRDVDVQIHAENYRSEKLKLSVNDTQKKRLALSPSKKHAFISKRDGAFDLFTIDADGKNIKKILPGTGSEREDSLLILNHPAKDKLALVSTRGNLYSQDGQLLSVLSIVDLQSEESFQVIESESIQPIDFIGDKLILVIETKDARDDAKDRYQLVSYDIESKQETNLASANYFNDVMVAADTVFYSPATLEDKKKAGFFKVNPDGSERESILGKEAWNFFRANFDKLHVAFSDEWYEYDLNTSQLNRLDGSPANDRSRIYVTSPDGSKSLWVDERDGKGVLLLHDHKSGEDSVIASAGGLVNPVRWLDNDHVVYRINTNSETADYVINLKGGEAKKVQDVTHTSSIDRFYIY